MRRTDSPDVPSDLDIARTSTLRPIDEVAADIGLERDDFELYGDTKAKLTLEATHRLLREEERGTTVVVTAMTPTPKGAGKTVTTVGLAQALHQLGENASVAVREPSLGPVFGIKGGAAGGGYSQVLPMEDINLQFTGDIPAISAAHNLLSAMLDAHIHHGNDLNVDVDEVSWPRTVDMNDRSLRETTVGLGGRANGPPREDGHVITAASELMAILCLSENLGDLKARLRRTIVAYDHDGNPVTAGDLDAAGAMATLLKDAIRPNLVQTIEGSPAFVHGGPFANIATGTNTRIADDIGLALSDYLVTEAGFGADLGFEKYADIVARADEDIAPDVAVLVVSARDLKYHGLDQWPVDYDAIAEAGIGELEAGFENLERHVETLEAFGVRFVVAINHFAGDDPAEVEAIVEGCEARDFPVAVSDVHAYGGEGGLELARAVREQAELGSDYAPLYDLDQSLREKVETVATQVYGASGVEYTSDARRDIKQLETLGLDDLPVCISKTPHSVTDDASKKGAPTDWTLTVRELYPSAGAGFVVALTGDVLTMPGLPAEPAAEAVDVEEDGTVRGLF
ncbi:formate--tetrahydrofolate ligase [Haladaptatus sp. NG-WS-4]